MELSGNIATKLSQHDMKILQSISIGLRGMSFLADNGKQTMENYLFIDCGEKLDPNNVLHECYHQYSSITGEEGNWWSWEHYLGEMKPGEVVDMSQIVSGFGA